MPLSKSVATSMGVPATYWSITAIAANLTTMQITYTFGGFKDQAAQAAGNDPLTSQDMTFPITSDNLATLAAVVAIGEGHAIAAGLLAGASQVA
jgi:hypothetical protein